MSKIALTAALTVLLSTLAVAAQAAPYWHEHRAALSAPQLIDRDVALKGAFAVGRDPDAHVRFELRRDNPYY
jgi:hypothetical protein